MCEYPRRSGSRPFTRRRCATVQQRGLRSFVAFLELVRCAVEERSLSRGFPRLKCTMFDPPLCTSSQKMCREVISFPLPQIGPHPAVIVRSNGTSLGNSLSNHLATCFPTRPTPSKPPPSRESHEAEREIQVCLRLWNLEEIFLRRKWINWCQHFPVGEAHSIKVVCRRRLRICKPG